MSNATVLKENSFDQEVSSGVTLVDFWAEWCNPCLQLNPTLDEIAGEYEGKATLGKVNVDEEPGLAQKFGVSSIPTLIVMKDGSEVQRFVGVTKKGDIAAALDQAIG